MAVPLLRACDVRDAAADSRVRARRDALAVALVRATRADGVGWGVVSRVRSVEFGTFSMDGGSAFSQTPASPMCRYQTDPYPVPVLQPGPVPGNASVRILANRVGFKGVDQVRASVEQVETLP